MRRSAVSIASKIAEGTGRGSSPDFCRFIEFAYSSLMELITQMKIPSRQGFLAQPAYSEAYEKSEQIARMLSDLRSSLTTQANH